MANERRLIDVSDEHIKEILAPVPYYPDEIWKFTAMTKRFPTVDAVEVVRCKDCQYSRPLNAKEKLLYLDECKACYNGDATIEGYNIVMPEHFCSYGERRCE